MNETAVKVEKRRRWWPVLLAAVLCAGAFAFTELSDSSFRYPAALALAIVTTLVLIIWFVVKSALSSRKKWTVLAVGAFAAVALLMMVRTDGWSGDMVPRFAWRWTPQRGELLALPAEDAGMTADLSAISPKDSPQFLGMFRDGMVREVDLDPRWQDAPPREVWRRQIGAGWGSFAVVGDFAVTQEQRGDDEATVCYRVSTGQPVWSHANVGVRFSEEMGGVGPRATPTIATGRVYVMGATGILDCLDGTDGRRLWTHNVVTEARAKMPDWAKSCSPLVHEGRVIVSAGGPNGYSLVAYDAESGELLWHGGDAPSSYCSPIVASLAGKQQIVIVNAQSVAAHDPATGELLWEHAFPGEFPKATQPIVINDSQLLISAGYGLGTRLLQVTQSAAGKFVVDEVWQSLDLKPKFTNLVVVEQHIYGLSEGIFTCIDLAAGKRQWKKGRYGHGQILLVGDLILVQGEKGEIRLLDPDPEQLQEVAEYPALSSKTWNNPVLAGKHLLLRNDQEAVCFELPLAK